MPPLPPNPRDVPGVDGGSGPCSTGDNCVCLQHENSGFGASCTHCSRNDPPPPPTPPSISCPSASSLIQDSVPLKESEKIRRVVTALVKGFSIGAGLKGGLALFSILVRLRRRLSASRQWVSLTLLNFSSAYWHVRFIPFLFIGSGSDDSFLVVLFNILCFNQ